MLNLKVKKLHPDAILPKRCSNKAACWDIYSVEDVYFNTTWPNLKSVSTGLAFEIPEGYRMSIRPRSGLAFKKTITVANSPATIDEDYRGEIKIGLIQFHYDGYFMLTKGSRIAQICLEKVEEFKLEVVEELSDTERGDGGFGSTGV